MLGLVCGEHVCECQTLPFHSLLHVLVYCIGMSLSLLVCAMWGYMGWDCCSPRPSDGLPFAAGPTPPCHDCECGHAGLQLRCSPRNDSLSSRPKGSGDGLQRPLCQRYVLIRFPPRLLPFPFASGIFCASFLWLPCEVSMLV